MISFTYTNVTQKVPFSIPLSVSVYSSLCQNFDCTPSVCHHCATTVVRVGLSLSLVHIEVILSGVITSQLYTTKIIRHRCVCYGCRTMRPLVGIRLSTYLYSLCRRSRRTGNINRIHAGKVSTYSEFCQDDPFKLLSRKIGRAHV